MPQRRGPEGKTARWDEQREFERGTKHTAKEDGSDEAILSLIKWSTPSSGECGEKIGIEMNI